MDPCPSTSGAGTPPKKKAKPWYKMSVKKEWFSDPELKDWLVIDKNDSSKCRCLYCQFTFTNPNKSALIKHAGTDNHNKAVQASGKGRITSFYKKAETGQASKVARCETIVAGFFAEHEIPFQVADHFWDLMRHAAPDSDIIKHASSKRTKMTYLTVNGLGTEEEHRVASLLRGRKYSILMDESTDVSVAQVLAVVARVYDPDARKIHDLLLDLVEPGDATAQGLFDALLSSLEAAEIDKTNIIGFGADNCATMMGVNGGVRALLENVAPGLFVMGCICHSLALCAGHAAKCLPSWLEMFVKDVASYLSRSPKRRDTLRLIQEAVMLPCHQIPKVAQTRWLSRGMVLQSILEQWEALGVFFRSESATEDGKENRAASISAQFCTAGTKHMLVFLHFVIKKVDALNILFQSEDCQLHRLYAKMAEGYRTILSLFVRPGVLSSVALHEVDPEDGDACLPIEKIDLGGRCESLLLEEPLIDGERKLRLDALEFLQRLCAEMRKRFDMNPASVLAHLKILDPEVAAKPASDCGRPRNLAPLMVQFKRLVPESQRDDLNDEWRELPSVLISRSTAIHQEPAAFWAEVSNMEDNFGRQRFPTLANFIKDLMSLPHSTAAVERIFSQVRTQ